MSLATARAAIEFEYDGVLACRFFALEAARKLWQIGLLEKLSERKFRFKAKLAQPAIEAQSFSVPHTLARQLQALLESVTQPSSMFLYRSLPPAEIPGVKVLLPISRLQMEEHRGLRADAVVFCMVEEWS